MRWRDLRRSSNVEDRRFSGGRGKLVGGGIGTIVIALIILVLGGNPSQLFNFLEPGSGEAGEYRETPEEREAKEFVSVVLAETEDVWGSIYRQNNSEYRPPTLVLFSGSVESACGMAGAATGPFYCPGDSKVYIDLSFSNELQRRFNAPGDFALAYVVAHEVGHHIQNLMGITGEVAALRRKLSEEEYNRYSVRLELQADFFAGVWAHYAERTKNILEEGDIEEALNAASAVGDDNIQKQSQGYISPETFTHGTSEQRKRWFYKGYRTGDINQGDTFNTESL